MVKECGGRARGTIDDKEGNVVGGGKGGKLVLKRGEGGNNWGRRCRGPGGGCKKANTAAFTSWARGMVESGDWGGEGSRGGRVEW